MSGITYVLDLVQINVVLITVGIFLLMVELFLPNFGVMGILGGIKIILGILFSIILSSSLIEIIIILALVTLLWGLIFTYFIISPRHSLLRRIGIFRDMGEKEDEESSDFDLHKLIGRTGNIVKDCNPVGKIEIDGEYYQCASENEKEVIKEKTKVVIKKWDGAYLIVGSSKE